MSYQVAALYHFARLDDFRDMRTPLLERATALGLCGTLLLAREGINGTIAGSDAAIADLIAYLKSDPRLSGIDCKYSRASEPPFKRMKVKLKKEIVTLGVPGVDPSQRVGTYVQPEDWNALIRDPSVVVIDTRNDYEVEIGSFVGAVDPKIATFRNFPAYVAEAAELRDKPRVAMFCTGGIRCEKASALMLELGFPEVFHLKGGILNYLEKIPEAESLWQGDCFVFDERVALTHGLAESACARDPATGRVLNPENGPEGGAA